MQPLSTPIAFFVFNRPDETSLVFDVIRQVKPQKLFVIVDSPRPQHPTDGDRCEKVLAIVKQIDWNCEVLYNIANSNLGCRDRVSSGIDWVFSHVESAIILEDDCLPDVSFFQFCQVLLDCYWDDPNILGITGSNILKSCNFEESYTFSRYPLVWGWATWKRSWKEYDVHIKKWSTINQKEWLYSIFHNNKTVWNWQRNFNSTYEKRLDTWDFQWFFNCWIQNGIVISPRENLISNIGFGSEATHTKWRSPLANIQRNQMKFPLIHPHNKVINEKFDRLIQEKAFNISFYRRALLKLLDLLG